MTATLIEMPRSIFNFSGQTHLDTFSIRFEEVSIDFDNYDDLVINGLRLAMEAIRLRADDFSYWQRRRPVGRPAYEDRVVLRGQAARCNSVAQDQEECQKLQKPYDGL